MTEQLERFITLLKGIFELDKSDLDFGIYRIMNIRKKEIEKFLTVGLPQKVQEALKPFAADTGEIKKRIAEIEKQCDSVGVPVENSKMATEYAELKTQLAKGVDLSGLEADVYSHLYSFFNRYYEDGDFISKRRYKEGVYAIPYEGEEVKLYWANQDQYYIKTSENFKDYTFVAEGYTIHFKLVDATTEQNNNKESADNKRVFMLYTENSEQPELKTFEFDAEKKEFIARFIFDVPLKKKFDYAADNAEKIKDWISANSKELRDVLFVNASSDPKKVLTLIEKHLKAYVAKNSFDYFIHKDLHKFLSRELDFYIKNEVMHLDDVDTPDEKQVSTYLAKIRAIKRVGNILIEFLSSIENFQKKLWLKKKFVTRCEYCITLDRIPEEFYPEIVANDEQRAEWVKNYKIDQIKGDLTHHSFSVPLTIEFLKENPLLVIDTAYFSSGFKEKVLEKLDSIENDISGVLIKSENAQALSLLRPLYREKIKCVYIDPPYNTGGDDFIYKDNYQDSSWLSLMSGRFVQTIPFFAPGGTIAVSIDLKEIANTISLLDSALGSFNRRANISVRRASISGAKVINPGPVNISENVVIYSNGKSSWEPQQAYREKDYDSRYGTYILNPTEHYEKWKFSTVLNEFANDCKIAKSQLKKQLGDKYEEKLLQFVIQHGDSIVQFASLDENSVSAEAIEFKQKSKETPDVVVHLEREDANDYYMLNGKLILFYKDRLRWMGESLVPVELISDIWDDVLPNDLHNEGGVRLKKGKKPEKLINRIFESTTKKGQYILDYFAGSATSGAVAIKSGRKFVNIESSSYFRNIPLQRLKNTLHGDSAGVSSLYKWNGGGMFKYLTLESYEDALSNVTLPDEDTTEQLIARFGDEYLVKYLLDLNTAADVLNLKAFAEPFSYKLKATEKNETKEVNVDLMETFNYLIGLTVEKLYARKTFTASPDPAGEYEGAVKLTPDNNGKYTFRQIEGKLPDGKRCLIFWRNVTEDLTESSAALDAYFQHYRINPADREYDIIYVNGDNHLENLRTDTEMWKVQMIEPEFRKRMFEEE